MIAFLAAWRLGAISVLTPAAARRDELRFFLNDTRAKVLVVANQGACMSELEAIDRAEIPSVEHVVAYPDATGTGHLSWEALTADRPDTFEPVAHPADAVALIWHTGGTTGVPKACYHTARRLVLAAECTASGYDVADDDVHMFPAPIGHAAGWLSRLTFSLVAGITFVELEDFRNPQKVLRAAADHRVTWLLAMGTTWAQMLPVLEKDPAAYDLSALRRTFAPFITSNGRWLYDAWRGLGFDLLNPVGSTAFAAWFFIPPNSTGALPHSASGPPPMAGSRASSLRTPRPWRTFPRARSGSSPSAASPGSRTGTGRSCRPATSARAGPSPTTCTGSTTTATTGTWAGRT